MHNLNSYVKVLEDIIERELLPIYNSNLKKVGKSPTNINRLVVNYRKQPIAALLQPKRRKS